MIAEIKALVVVTDRFGENFTFKPPLRMGNLRKFAN
jgi:cytochrome c-type biogenesis protein CcmH/NrfF